MLLLIWKNYSAFAFPGICCSSEAAITVCVFVTLTWPSSALAAAVHAAVVAIDVVSAAFVDHSVVVIFAGVSVFFLLLLLWSQLLILMLLLLVFNWVCILLTLMLRLIKVP